MSKVTRMVLVLALAAMFVVAGCKKDETVTTETTATTETSVTTATETTVAPADTAATTATTTTNAQSTGVAECDSYLAALDKYMMCDKVPQAARDAQASSAQQMKNGWASWANLPEDARKVAQDAAKTSCTTALNTLKQASTATGCPVE